MDINVSFLLKTNRVSDYIPGISTITNLIDLFQKCMVLSGKQKANISKNHYYTHLQQKSFSRCIVLLIPVIGNILVAIYDFAKGKPNYADVTLVAAQPVPLATLKPFESARPPKPTRMGIAIDINCEAGEHAESYVLGTNEAKAKRGIHKKHSQALVAAGYPAETALKLVSAKKPKKEVSSLAEQPSLGTLDCCEHSLIPDLQTKLALNTPRASAKNIYLEQNAQLHVHSHAHSIIQCKAEPPLSQAELDPQNLVSPLRHYYLSQKTISIFRIKTQQEWEFKVPLEEIYVRLGMIENEERKTRDQALNKHSEYLQDTRIPTYETIFELKEKIEIEKLFEHKSFEEEDRKRVLIQGAAGIGKSTLCHYISYHWAKGELWQGVFSYLFWIPLRNFTIEKYPPDKEYTPADLIAKEYAGKIDRRVIEACIHDSTFLEKTLLVLDGYDELPAKAQANTSLAAAFKQLKELFPHILITSRPGNCSFERSCELELLGFDKEGIEGYIDRFFKYVQAGGKKQKLNRLLKTSPQVLSLAQIPINLTLLCCLFHEDPQVFDTEQSITMTAIYERIVNWMYQWFLLRRIDQGKSSQTQEQILAEKKLRQNPEVANISAAFEEMANFAMKNDTLYLSKQEIEDFKGDKISSNELSDCGLMRIPGAENEAEEKGYFIHLTFQEFLTASKVANQYLKGERQACQEFIRSYKFEPRYALVLHMIAGSLSIVALSNRRHADALQSFFDDLFAAPQDLAVSGELTLIAECFEECQDPTMVKQYDGFIKLVKGYLKHLYLQGLGFESLLRNKNLFNHPEIVHTIRELLSDTKTREKMLKILLRLVRTGVSLAAEIVGAIAEDLKDPKKNSVYKWLASHVIEEAAMQGGELSKETLTVLKKVLKEGDSRTKISAAEALETMAKQGGELSKEVLAALIQALKESDSRTKISVASILGKIAEQGGELPKETLDALTQALKEGDEEIKGSAASALEAIAKQGGRLPKETLDGLIQAHKESYSRTKISAAEALETMAKQGGELSKEVLAALIQALKESDSRSKISAASILGKIAEQGGELPKEALDALTQALKEGDKETKQPATVALKAISEQGGELPKEALAVLIQALKESDGMTKYFAAEALEAMAKQGGELSKEVLAALIQALKESDSRSKISAASILGKIAKQGGELPEEALAALTQALKEWDKETKQSAAVALKAISEQGGELSKEALAVLIQALKESDGMTKYFAAEALEAMAKQGDELPKETLDALTQALKEGDGETKQSAASILGKIAMQGDELPKEALAALIQALKENDGMTKYFAANALRLIAKKGGELPKEALAALIQALKESDSRAKISAAEALKAMAKQGGELPKEMLGALTQALKEGDEETKYSAASILGKIAMQGDELPKEALAALIQALQEGDRETKQSAASVLEAIAKQRGELTKEALAALIQALQEGDRETKQSAASVLEAIAKQRGELQKEALAALIQVFKESKERTKTHAASALKAIAKQGGELPKEVLAALIQALKEGDSMTKVYAANVMKARVKQGGEVSKELLDSLIQAFKEGDREIKYSAADALRAIAKQGGEVSKEMLAALIQALQEGDREIKYSAADALGAIARQGGEFSKEMLPALIQALQEDDRETKRSVADVLEAIAKQRGELPKEALAALIQALKEGDSMTKVYAANVMKARVKQGGEVSKELLDSLIQAFKEGDRETKRSVADALEAIARQGGEFSKEALTFLIQALKESDSMAKVYVANVMKARAKQGGEVSKELVDSLIQALKEGNSETKDSAGETLIKIAKQRGEFPREVLAALLQALKENVGLTRFYAVTALKKVDKDALLKMGGKALALIAEVCFFIDYNFSVKGQQLQVSDKRVTYLSELTLELSYEEMREQLPPELGVWRKRLDSLSSTEFS
ncbi:HEAT repeat domain-containing protein [Parachlamydia sp. AcF125]|uniref:HEAT repeat domain-containing protein n=1 Tax=Parachlamydia sp. AcF125 TaxID=2795736 RepID=UPI001BC8D931|nr:HEAT repeat domain-containing protein [Parachlamydia sp. AcF125]MBS4168596.1 hypothetical protein [Parachlamydia sp. AcF125]